MIVFAFPFRRREIVQMQLMGISMSLFAPSGYWKLAEADHQFASRQSSRSSSRLDKHSLMQRRHLTKWSVSPPRMTARTANIVVVDVDGGGGPDYYILPAVRSLGFPMRKMDSSPNHPHNPRGDPQGIRDTMSVPASRAHSEVFSASQYGGGLAPTVVPNRYSINFFVLPTFILHIVGLACLWALWYYMRFTTLFPYHQRVFYCRDIELYKPNFRPEDFNVHVPDALMYVLCFVLPPFVIFVGEVMFWLFSSKPRKAIYATCGECKVHLFTRRLFRFVSVFIFGALITQIFVDTIKFLTGYHRPYFLSLCDVSYPNCTAPLEFSPSPSPYLACKYREADHLRYASLSFPSLHAAFSSYAAIFACCYIYYMVNLRGAPLLRPFLIFGFLGLTLVDSFSRINGYKNHWRDIWVGWLIGFFIAVFLCQCVYCFQEVYHLSMGGGDKAAMMAAAAAEAAEERISPFFSWFRLPRVQAPSVKEDYAIYEEDVPQSTAAAADRTAARHRRNQDRTYEVTTTTEHLHRTIVPPGQQQGNNSGVNGGGSYSGY
uniref:AcidPPc domain-containing protein n=1 Tax=Panagrellus redivivus TaxID=6233 RepID=A0A7E4VAP0_PANRE